jgi:hypothetical protein
MGTGLVAALALTCALGQTPTHVVAQGGDTTVGPDQAVGDVLVIDGRLELAGVVRGYLYAVSSTVVLHSSAVLLSAGALHGGHLVVEPGARLGALTLAGTTLDGELPEGANVERTRSPSRAALRAMRARLPFARPTPAEGVTLDAVRAWTPPGDYRLEHSLDDPRELVVGGVAKLTFTSDKIVGVAQRGFHADGQGTVLLTAVELADATTGAALWKALAQVPERAVSASVRTALGDGAHWWFVRQRRGALLWQRGRWFFALETRADDDRADPLALTEQASIALTESFGDAPTSDLAVDLDAGAALRPDATPAAPLSPARATPAALGAPTPALEASAQRTLP